MTLDELKNYISSNEFIELPRSGTVPYGNNRVRFVPKLASYQTKSIVYINRDLSLEECRRHNQKIIDEHKPIVDKIFQYEFNKWMKLWLWWNLDNINWDSNHEDLKELLYFLTDKYLNNILKRCVKYKCKLK